MADSIYDMNVAIGQSGGNQNSIGSILDTMGEGTDPDAFEETRNYSNSWKGWLNSDGYPTPSQNGNDWTFDFNCNNGSVAHSYTKTMYVKVYKSTGTQVGNSSKSVTIAYSTYNQTESITITCAYPPAWCEVSFDGGTTYVRVDEGVG